MLTIGKLAHFAGVTVRTVRHYHQVGLLPEPDRDHSGYRRYGGDHVIRLSKITALTDAGIALAEIAELLDGDDEAYRRGLAAAQDRLDRRLAELSAARERLRLLQARSDELLVPPVAAAVLRHLSAVGIDPRLVELEREYWILGAVLFPELMPSSVRRMARQAEDLEGLVAMYRISERALDLDPADPELSVIADHLAEQLQTVFDPEEFTADPPGDPWRNRLMVDHLAEAVPAYSRLDALIIKRVTAAGWLPASALDDFDPEVLAEPGRDA